MGTVSVRVAGYVVVEADGAEVAAFPARLVFAADGAGGFRLSLSPLGNDGPTGTATLAGSARAWSVGAVAEAVPAACAGLGLVGPRPIPIRSPG